MICSLHAQTNHYNGVIMGASSQYWWMIKIIIMYYVCPKQLSMLCAMFFFHCCNWWDMFGYVRHGYVKLRVAHAPGMTGTFSLSPRVSDPAQSAILRIWQEAHWIDVMMHPSSYTKHNKAVLYADECAADDTIHSYFPLKKGKAEH